MLSQLTPEFFDTLIIVVIIIGLALAVVRLYADFTRPIPPEDDAMKPVEPPENVDEDTRPNEIPDRTEDNPQPPASGAE